MLPIVEVPESILRGMQPYREVFCRDEGFEHVCRYVTGLIVSPNKTLEGIYDLQVWEGDKPSRRAMHAGFFSVTSAKRELVFFLLMYLFIKQPTSHQATHIRQGTPGSHHA